MHTIYYLIHKCKIAINIFTLFDIHNYNFFFSSLGIKGNWQWFTIDYIHLLIFTGYILFISLDLIINAIIITIIYFFLLNLSPVTKAIIAVVLKGYELW